MAHEEDDLLALAGTLERALRELADTPADSPVRDEFVRIERWTLRWAELVANLLYAHPHGVKADALRARLASIRAILSDIRATSAGDGGRGPDPTVRRDQAAFRPSPSRPRLYDC